MIDKIVSTQWWNQPGIKTTDGAIHDLKIVARITLEAYLKYNGSKQAGNTCSIESGSLTYSQKVSIR